MKNILLALSLFLPLVSQGASKAPEVFNEGRCFDIKQSLLSDIKARRMEKKDLGMRIDRLAEKCDQPELAGLLRKALERRTASLN